jgi:hypothetical protein
MGPWFMRIGVVILFLVVGGYAVYTIGINQAEYGAGFVTGVILFYAILFFIYRIAGPWGCYGAAVRVGVIGLAVLKAVTLLRILQR